MSSWDFGTQQLIPPGLCDIMKFQSKVRPLIGVPYKYLLRPKPSLRLSVLPLLLTILLKLLCVALCNGVEAKTCTSGGSTNSSPTSSDRCCASEQQPAEDSSCCLSLPAVVQTDPFILGRGKPTQHFWVVPLTAPPLICRSAGHYTAIPLPPLLSLANSPTTPRPPPIRNDK